MCKQIPNTFGLSKENDWIMEMYCATCDKYFAVCTLCPANKKQFLNREDVINHTRLNSHKKRLAKNKQKNAVKQRKVIWKVTILLVYIMTQMLI